MFASNKKTFTRITFTCLFICLLIIVLPYGQLDIHAYIEEAADSRDIYNDKNLMAGFSRSNTYEQYINNYYAEEAGESIELEAASFTRSSCTGIRKGLEISGKSNSVSWETGWLEWNVSVPRDGLYNIELEYYPLEGKGRDIEIQLMINGNIPFEEAKRLILKRIWKDEHETGSLRDDNGYDIYPKQVEAPAWVREVLKDVEGRYSSPYKFFLGKGSNTIRIVKVSEPFVLAGIKLYNNEVAAGYEQIFDKNAVLSDNTPEGFISIYEAEKPLSKSDAFLHAIYDRSDPLTRPYSASSIRLNTIGGDYWNSPGQKINWEIEAPEDGYYKIALRYRQNTVRGMKTTRKLYIDGKIPFKEAEELEFEYDIKWKLATLGSNGKEYMFYLTKGRHILTLEASMGKLAPIYRALEDALYKLNYIYRKIVMITGPFPDEFRDYYLDVEIPSLMEMMEDTGKIIKEQKLIIDNMAGVRGGEAELLEVIAAQLDDFIKRPDTIPTRLIRFKDNISGLAAMILKLKEQPLELDYIVLASPDAKLPKSDSSVLQQLAHEIRLFYYSFIVKHSSIGKEKKDAIDVWVSIDRDQAQILKNLIDTNFTPQYGIPVNLSLVQKTLTQAVMAGKGPDIALNVDRTEPLNMGVRGVLTELNTFPDFEEVESRFMPGATVPYKLSDKCYALPETQSFNMMFYRTDILNELGINPPETWDEFYKILHVIQGNNMEVGFYDIFGTFLQQRGGKYYTPDASRALLDSPEAIDAFDEWTGLYNRYGLPLAFDFYSRFRTGEMPMGIMNYLYYPLLQEAAPEIRGLWEMAPIPGVRDKDGKIIRKEPAFGNACIIVKEKGRDDEACWQFLKWWTSADIQSMFGVEVETIKGRAERYATANVEAFQRIPWSQREYNLLMEQWKQVEEIPEVLGGYYVGRSIGNAFTSVVIKYRNPREMLLYYNREINREITRKRIEYGMPVFLGEGEVAE